MQKGVEPTISPSSSTYHNVIKDPGPSSIKAITNESAFLRPVMAAPISADVLVDKEKLAGEAKAKVCEFHSPGTV